MMFRLSMYPLIKKYNVTVKPKSDHMNTVIVHA